MAQRSITKVSTNPPADNPTGLRAKRHPSDLNLSIPSRNSYPRVRAEARSVDARAFEPFSHVRRLSPQNWLAPKDLVADAFIERDVGGEEHVGDQTYLVKTLGERLTLGVGDEAAANSEALAKSTATAMLTI